MLFRSTFRFPECCHSSQRRRVGTICFSLSSAKVIICFAGCDVINNSKLFNQYKLKYIVIFTTKLRVKMLTHNFLDKLEMTARWSFRACRESAADYHNDLTYTKSIIKKYMYNNITSGFSLGFRFK